VKFTETPDCPNILEIHLIANVTSVGAKISGKQVALGEWHELVAAWKAAYLLSWRLIGFV
jgi:hypothetical protein